MTPQIPEWITWGIPFLSGVGGGVAGVYAGLKVGIARLETNYCNLRAMVAENKAILKEQVGEKRCREYREDCQENIHNRLNDIFKKLDKIERDMVGIAIKVARIERSTE